MPFSLRLILSCVCLAICLSQSSPSVLAEELPVGWVETRFVPAPEARQAAAADQRSVYAIDSRVVARYDRKTGKKTGASSGEAQHLNSGFIHQGRLYAAHSNFPKTPEQSEVKVLDLNTLELATFHRFQESPHGSLTVVVFDQDSWWCVFARYGADNSQTMLVRFDEHWQEQGCWTFPPSVISDLGKMSISGGIWRQGEFLTTGHDKPVIYRLRLPEQGTILQHVGTVSTPFPGQGIAADPVTGGLVGVNRKEHRVIFARPER